MEYAVVVNDLTDLEIHPVDLTEKYTNLLLEDVKEYFSSDKLVEFHCPTSFGKFVSAVFHKMGFQYFVSKDYDNIYMSPRPNKEALMKFYQTSKAREYWYQSILKETANSRREKIINSHIDWVISVATENGMSSNRRMIEMNPLLWDYHNTIIKSGNGDSYGLYEPFFSVNWAGDNIDKTQITSKPETNYDIVCLFGALNRSLDPKETLYKANEILKSGGLGFITDILASGFEIQMLGGDSNLIMPPEKMNIFTVEGLTVLLENAGFEILEFSTPGLLDVQNVFSNNKRKIQPFFEYVKTNRKNSELIFEYQKFLQSHKLSSITRIVVKKR